MSTSNLAISLIFFPFPQVTHLKLYNYEETFNGCWCGGLEQESFREEGCDGDRVADKEN